MYSSLNVNTIMHLFVDQCGLPLGIVVCLLRFVVSCAGKQVDRCGKTKTRSQSRTKFRKNTPVASAGRSLQPDWLRRHAFILTLITWEQHVTREKKPKDTPFSFMFTHMGFTGGKRMFPVAQRYRYHVLTCACRERKSGYYDISYCAKLRGKLSR